MNTGDANDKNGTPMARNASTRPRTPATPDVGSAGPRPTDFPRMPGRDIPAPALDEPLRLMAPHEVADSIAMDVAEVHALMEAGVFRTVLTDRGHAILRSDVVSYSNHLLGRSPTHHSAAVTATRTGTRSQT